MRKNEVWETRPEISPNVLDIPEDGYVISAHGTTIGLISQTVLGDYVALE